jgi:hypothetical protein
MVSWAQQMKQDIPAFDFSKYAGGLKKAVTMRYHFNTLSTLIAP